jgi:hypothetical protein
MTNYGVGGAHRAGPIAFGNFSIGSGTLVGSSGNVTLAVLANDIYRITVLGESSPSTWTVTAELAYSNPGNPDHIHLIRTGIPNASGQIQIWAPCDSGCGVFTSQDVQVHFVVYKP